MKTKATTVWHKMWGVAVLVCVFTSLESRAQKAVEFFHTYLITQGEVITFSDSYVDNTKTAYLADILEPVAGNPKQFRFLGTTGWYCFQSFDVNPFLRGARLDWGTPNSDQYDDWKSDDIVNNNTVYNSHRFIEPTNPGTTLTDNGANGYEYIYVMPVNDEKNGTLYEQYRALAEKEEKVLFGGRLGEYKYYDMDKVIERALEVCREELV